MKLILKIDSAAELATLIPELNLEIVMPFLNKEIDNDHVLLNLTKTMQDSFEKEINELKKQLENAKKANIKAFENYLNENKQEECPAVVGIQNHFAETHVPEQAIHFDPINDDKNNRQGMSIVASQKDIIPAANNTEVRHCQVCGNPVPKAKKAPFCSTKCYNANYVKEHSSKKVKSPNRNPD